MRTHAQYRRRALVALAGLALLASTGTSARPFPELIPLPADFGPEGIAVGNGTTFYAGSLAAVTRGQILGGDLRTGETTTLVPADGVPATGIKHDARSKLLFVARAASGMGTVFDAESGGVVASCQFHAAPTFVNDVVITREAAYFTDTQAPFLYRVALGPAGEPAADFTEIPLPPFNNASPHQHAAPLLIHANCIFTSHTPVFVNLGGDPLPNADGLLLEGKTLYVVQNVRNRIAVVELSPDYLSGAVVRFITEPFTSNPATKVPTTIAKFGKALYAVTAGFAAPAPDFVVRVEK